MQLRRIKNESSEIFSNNPRSEIFSNNQSLIVPTYKPPIQLNIKVTPVKQKTLDNSMNSSKNQIIDQMAQGLEVKNEEVLKLKKINEEQQFNIKTMEVKIFILYQKSQSMKLMLYIYIF